VVSGRLSRQQAAGNAMTGSEQVLVENWCQQYPSHSVGAVEFGADGKLYASGGDGASFNFVDYGQDGSPLNPCGDPPGGVGAAPTLMSGAEMSAWCAANIANLEIEHCGPAGHLAPEDQPEAIAAAILKWVDRHQLR
jgi:pimeloyl-ACP methyl ester carboxylesterase